MTDTEEIRDVHAENTTEHKKEEPKHEETRHELPRSTFGGSYYTSGSHYNPTGSSYVVREPATRYISHDDGYATSYYPGTTNYNTGRVYSNGYSSYQPATTYTTSPTYTTGAPTYSYVSSGDSPVRYTGTSHYQPNVVTYTGNTQYRPAMVGNALYGLAGNATHHYDGPKVVTHHVDDPNEVVVKGGKPQKFREKLPNKPGKETKKNFCGCAKGSMGCC